MNVTVYDFTGIYENEGFDFYKKEGARSLFCSLKDISGTNCICDDYAYKEIREKVKALDASSSREPVISFFDNGNYHYMSKLLMDVLCEKSGIEGSNSSPEFDLIFFDHHPDMKWTSYGEVLSCGSWVLNALKDRKELGQVFIIGADPSLCAEVMEENPELFGDDGENASNPRLTSGARVHFLKSVNELPDTVSSMIYLSIDKDVLDEDELATNWDQGNMTISELEKSLIYLKERFGSGILSVDVCGESLSDSADAYSERGIEASNKVNSMIIKIFAE
ncbi:hypothetical protein [Butyrivibrio sp. WCD2001]|uniref:hypothetical protein n=1 Tax=Butyrivibrio sp. WCD2001 TaxID=1280681 RepID=UPI00041EE8B6|nr:hypothetical protein [Butyrivibrio sp. WCD2001]